MPQITDRLEQKVVKTYRKELWFNTPHRRDFINITGEIQQCVAESGVRKRFCFDKMLKIILLLCLITSVIACGAAPSGEVKIIGPEEIVFAWTRDRCDMLDIPDAPARAFRDADGKVQLLASHYVSRRMIGDTLNSVKHECDIIMNSNYDPDPSKFDYKEWINSLYTLDGNTIYALVHNEYQGHTVDRWNAENDFFNLFSRNLNSRQGYNNWYYQEWDGRGYKFMSYNPQKKQWEGSREWCLLGSNWAHPDMHCPVRKWVSPVTNTISITGNAHDLDPKCGDGVVVKILKGNTELWNKTISNGDTKGFDFDLKTSVKKGDAIYFIIEQRNTSDCDTTYFNPSIITIPCQCKSGDWQKCWCNTITFAKSTDKGRTYVHAEAPNHLVASVPYRYEGDTGPWGVFEPSNIIYNPKDGYYYVMLHLETRFLQEWGTSVMRTKTLDDPTSWRAWDGNDFKVCFVNPYTEPNADPSKHICQPVSRDNIGKLHRSLTFNTYFNKFLLVGENSVWDPNQGKAIHGFCYSLSDDLIHWSPRKLIMKAKLPWTPDLPGEILLYSSLIDPNDTSRNFENTGQRPYLYFTRMHSYTFENPGLDRDLVRVPIQFE
jgi:hypothetical protein